MSDKKVVVLLSLVQLKHKEKALVAARFPELGLTAYGRTETQAEDAVKGVFRRWVEKHREAGVLQQRLEQAGVRWYWLDEYDHWLPVEDMSQATAGAMLVA